MRIKIKEVSRVGWSYLKNPREVLLRFESRWDKDLFIILIFLCSSLLSFYLGRVSLIEEEKPTVAYSTEKREIDERVVASRTGTKYHLPWCAGALAIKEENKLWFNTPEDAQRAGYTPAGNCKGIR